MTCHLCGGAGWLRRDVPTWHADFAKAVRCAACNPAPAPPVRLEAVPPRAPRLRIVS